MERRAHGPPGEPGGRACGATAVPVSDRPAALDGPLRRASSARGVRVPSPSRQRVHQPGRFRR